MVYIPPFLVCIPDSDYCEQYSDYAEKCIPVNIPHCARALRTASLGIMGVTLANCGDSAAFLNAIAPSDEASIRALTVALAASAVDADPADGPGLVAVRAAAADVDASLHPILDSLDSNAIARVVSGADAALAAVHLTPGIAQLGSLVVQAVTGAQALSENCVSPV